MEGGLMCGQLEPTRGIGDHDFKSLKTNKFPGKSFKGDLVIPTPEFGWFSLTNSAEDILQQISINSSEISVGFSADHFSFIVLASDGLWDMVSNCDVLQEIAEKFKKNHTLSAEIVQTAAEDLVRITRTQTRKKKEKMDNTTIILIGFVPCGDPRHYQASDSSCLYCFQPTCTTQTESILNSKASSVASSKKKKMQRNKKRKKKQKAKKK